MTLLALVLTPLGPLLGAWAGNAFVKELKIEGVSGSLLTGISVDKVDFDDGSVLVSLADIDVDFGGPDFSNSLVNVDSLSISSLDLVLSKSDTTRKRGEPVNIPDFGIAPVNLNVIKGSLGQYNITKEGQSLFSLTDLKLDNTKIIDNKILLDGVVANMAMQPTPISIAINSASLDMLQPHALDLKANMAWLHPDIGDVKADITGKGLLQAYELTVEGDIDNPELGKQVISAEASGDFDFIDFTKLSLTGDSGNVQASGELAWVPAISTDLAIDAKNLNAAQFVPEWPTDITSKLQLKVGTTDGKTRIGLDIDDLNGTVRGYPLTATGKVSMLNEELIFDALEIKSAKNVVKVNGRGTEPFDLSWDINAPDLSSLAAGVKGRVSARGTLTGDMKQPIINGKLDTTRLSFQGNSLDSGKLDIKTSNGDLQLDGKLQGLTVNNERIRNATLSGRGNIESHKIDLLANHSQAKVTASLDGGWDGTAWEGVLNQATVDNSAAGKWSLQKPTKIKLSAAGVATDELCMASSNGSACTNIDYNEQDGFSTSGKLANTPLDILNPVLPQGLTVKGLVGGEYNVTINPDLKGQANLNFSAGTVNLTKDGKVQRFGYRSGSLLADINGNDIKASTSIKLSDKGAIDASADIKLSPSDGKHIIDAKGDFTDIPLGLGQAFLPADMNLTGQASGAFNVNQNGSDRTGTLALASSDIQLIYNDASAGNQRYNFDQVKLNATLDNDLINADAALSLKGGGKLNTVATVDLSKPDIIKGIIANGEVEAMPLALARPYLPKEIDVDGVLTGDYRLTQGANGPVGQIDLEADGGAFTYKAAGAQAQRYRYKKVQLKASMQDDKILADAGIELQDGGVLTSKATVDLSQKDILKGITAEGQIKSMPLALARPYLPKDVDVEGLITGDYRLTQSQTGLVGQVDLQAVDGSFAYKAEGVERQRYRYNKVQLKASIQDDKVLADVGLELQGGAVLTSKASVDIKSLSGANPIFTAEGKVSAIPLDMAQAFLPKGLVVKGNINGTYQLQQQTQLQGNVAFDFDQGSVSYDDGVTGAQLYRFSSAKIIADIQGDNVTTDLSLSLQDGGTFSTKGKLNLAKPNNLYDFEGDGQLKAFPLALVQPYLPKTIKVKGVAEGSYQLTQRGGQQGKINLKLPQGSVSIVDEKGKEQTIAYELAELNATVNGKNIVADSRITLEQGGVIDGKGTIVLGANANAHQIDIKGQLISVPLSVAKPYLPEDFDLPGKINGTYRLSQRNGKQAGNVQLRLPNSYFTVATASGDKRSFPYQDGILNITLNDQRIDVDSSLDFQGRGTLKSRLQVVLRNNGSPTINGILEVNIPNIYWAQNYVPYSRGLRGQIVGKVSLSGVIDKPRVTGQIALTDGYLRLPQLGTELTDVNVRIQADQSNQARIVGTMNSGGGVLTANGSLSLQDIKSWSAQMSLRGNNIKFVDTNEAEAYMTPNLEITANPQAVVIAGTVDIPKANINLKDVPELSIDESDDVVVIGETVKGEDINAVRLQPNILVRLGREVFFKGFGFSTQLTGGLRVTNSRNTIVTNGTMQIVNGRYQAYGQDLKIANGRLVFNGPPKNVGVDVKAVREITDGEVGIQLSGTLQNLKSTIVSDPVLDDTDALSYLLTGNSLSSATGRETALLMQAVRGLGIDGSDGLVQKLGKSLGLDDLSIVTKDDFRDSELQLGKRLGPKLYVKYLVGIFDSAHRIAVDYKINKYLNLEVQAGEEQSVDLIYEYERN
jgi:autotransporter translocation and assembly factor TamB